MTAEKYFYVQDGKVLTGLDDLVNCMPEISEEAFAHHVNKEKNDFYNWVSEVIGDQEFANSIKKVKTKNGFLKKIKALTTA
ncbi:hypothetical protein RCC89_07495 [Cytophagaceae bacterium ABcell3]|nr:hypothetical protein RCC89_07495 [Cytophagaceae bacterium ABcell3]